MLSYQVFHVSYLHTYEYYNYDILLRYTTPAIVRSPARTENTQNMFPRIPRSAVYYFLLHYFDKNRHNGKNCVWSHRQLEEPVQGVGKTPPRRDHATTIPHNTKKDNKNSAQGPSKKKRQIKYTHKNRKKPTKATNKKLTKNK